jgi:L-fuculose-phosphate aldolase
MSYDIRKNIVEISKLMYNKGMVNAFEGNVSVLDGERIYITPSAVCKGFLTEEQIVVTDMEGIQAEGSPERFKPSSEIKLHIAAYKKRPDIRSVVHAHSPYATAFAVAGRPIETKAYPEMIVLFGKIPLAAYGTPSTYEISKGMEEHIDKYNIILLANHGVMAAGCDVYEAFFRLESAESIAKVLYTARMLGGERELPEDKLELLYAMRDKTSSGAI